MTDKKNFMQNTMKGASHLLDQQRIAESKNLSDPVDQCLEIWSQAISNYEQASLQLAESEASFKAWEAAIKMAHMRNKASGVMAEGLVKTHQDWEQRYLDVQTLGVKAETAKRILRISEATWETERSKQVTLRNLK